MMSESLQLPNPSANVPADASTAQWLLRLTLPSLALAGGLGALELARSRFQHQRMFSPTRYPEGCWNPAEHGVPFEDVFFDSEDGTRLHGWWIEHPRPRMTVVYCHGNTGSLGERVEIFRYLRRLRVNVFAFDYRGYGRSDGSPSEKGLFADVRAAIDHVTGERRVGLHRLVLFGHSLGGAVAVDGASHRPVAGLVVQSSFTQVRDMARHFYPDLPLHWIARNAFRSIEKVPQLTMPKLFVHGGEDPTVPYEHGERLLAAAAEPKYWLRVGRATHNDLHLRGGRRYLSRVSRFLRVCQRHGRGTGQASNA